MNKEQTILPAPGLVEVAHDNEKAAPGAGIHSDAAGPSVTEADRQVALTILGGNEDGYADMSAGFIASHRHAAVEAAVADLRAQLAAKTAEVETLRELLQDTLDGSVNAMTYPDGPCLERELRDRIRTTLAQTEGKTP